MGNIEEMRIIWGLCMYRWCVGGREWMNMRGKWWEVDMDDVIFGSMWGEMESEGEIWAREGRK